MLILFFAVFVSFSAFSQDYADTTVTVIIRNQPLREFFQQITSQTGLFFAYGGQVDDSRKVTVIARNQPLSQVLETLCSQLDLDYTIIDKQIVLKPKVQDSLPASLPHEYKISGYVTDSSTSEVLIGAQIYVDGRLVAFTNEYGFYTLKVSGGGHIIRYSYIGYGSVRKKINVRGNMTLNARLPVFAQKLDMVVVTAENTRPIRKNDLDYREFSSNIIMRNPGLGGAYDAIKSLQALPGFNFYGDGSLIFHVRGGLKSQNLILIDDAPVFNPVHLLGFFSAVSPYAVNDIRVYKNNLPLQYSGRTSSVIDIRIRDGNLNNYEGVADISPVISSFVVDGPIKKDKASFLASIRQSNINWLYDNKYTKLKSDFTDLHLKINLRASQKNRYYASLFFSSDKLQLSRDFFASSIRWGNWALALRWTHVFPNQTFMNSTFYTGVYSYNLAFALDTSDLFNSLIYNTGLKTDFTTHFSDKLNLKYGFKAAHFYFNPANINEYAYVPTRNTVELTAYAGLRVFLTEKIRLDLGTDLRTWLNVGPVYFYRYDEQFNFTGIDTIGLQVYNTFLRTEPRVALTAQLSEKWVANLSAGQYVQFLQLVSNSISPFTTVEAWLPSDPNIPDLTVRQLSAGINRKSSDWDFSFEAYYKQMYNVLQFSGFSSLLFNKYIESQLRFGKGVSAGIEMSLNKKFGRFNYWLSYSYSRTMLQSDYLWDGQWFRAQYDKPHSLYLNASYNTDRWQAGFTYTFTSGNRFTAPTGYYVIMDHKVPYYTEPNNAQMPDYSRADVYLKLRLNHKNTHLASFLTFSIFNIFGRKNAILVSFNKVEANEDFFYVPTNYIYEHDLMPSYYYLLKAVPMLSYTVKFR